MSHYLDTSAIVPLFLIEATTEVTTRWVGDPSRTLFVSDLVVTEFSSVLSRFIRLAALTEDGAAPIREQFELWRQLAATPLENLPEDIRMAGTLVRKPHPRLLPADAIHVATCRRLGLILVTYDRDLQTIAAREGVTWLSPS